MARFLQVCPTDGGKHAEYGRLIFLLEQMSLAIFSILPISLRTE